MPICARRAGAIGAHLRQQRDQGRLPEVRRLTRHVRAGDERDAAAFADLAREIAIIGDERFASRGKGRLDHGMAARFDDEGEGLVDDRPRPHARRGKFGERGGDVDFGQRFAEAANSVDLRHSRSAQPLEGGELQSQGAVGGRSDLRLELREFVSREPHRPGHGLAMDECRRMRRAQKALAVRLRRLDEEAEEMIVLDPELASSRRARCTFLAAPR